MPGPPTTMLPKHRYESSRQRQALVYRLSSPPPPNRTLEIVAARAGIGDCRIDPFGNSMVCNIHFGDRKNHSNAGAAIHGLIDRNGHCSLPVETASFDLIVLHFTIDELCHTASQQNSEEMISSLLREVRRALVYSGIVAGCFHSRWSWFSAKKLLVRRRSLNELPPWSVTKCKLALQSSGLDNVEIFNMLPNADSPMHLINTRRDVQSGGYERVLQQGATGHPWWLLTKREFVHAASLSPFFNWNYMFWATKLAPC